MYVWVCVCVYLFVYYIYITLFYGMFYVLQGIIILWSEELGEGKSGIPRVIRRTQNLCNLIICITLAVGILVLKSLVSIHPNFFGVCALVFAPSKTYCDCMNFNLMQQGRQMQQQVGQILPARFRHYPKRYWYAVPAFFLPKCEIFVSIQNVEKVSLLVLLMLVIDCLRNLFGAAARKIVGWINMCTNQHIFFFTINVGIYCCNSHITIIL